MQLALVIGNATSTVKHPSMTGCKLMIVQPFLADGKTPDGDPLITVDAVGAGIGEMALITSDGRYVRERLKDEKTPVRWAIIGTKDERG